METVVFMGPGGWMFPLGFEFSQTHLISQFLTESWQGLLRLKNVLSPFESKVKSKIHVE
ncbi:hypothetical protein ACWJJH_17230 [Endozoicomonadaceae bacterium StTr2]